MFDYQRDPKGNGGVAVLYAWGLLGTTDKPPKRSTRFYPQSEHGTRNWLWRIIFLMEKTWGNAMNFRWPQTKWKALLGFHVSFHGRRSKESVRCHAVLSCHRIQQVHACLPAGRFLTRADDGTQKFLRSDRLQTFGNPTASSRLSKSSSDNYHRNENSSCFWGLPSNSTSSTLYINIVSLCCFIHHLLSLYYRLLWMWCGWNFLSYPSISSRLQLAQKELITVIRNWL